MSSEQVAPLTDDELAALRKRVAYQIDSAAENNETWIDGEIWQKTLATIDSLAAERNDARSKLADAREILTRIETAYGEEGLRGYFAQLRAALGS